MNPENRAFFQLLFFQSGVVETLEFLILDLNLNKEKTTEFSEQLKTFAKQEAFSHLLKISFHKKPTKKYLELLDKKDFFELAKNESGKDKIKIIKLYKDCFDALNSTLIYFEKNKKIDDLLISLHKTNIAFHTLFLSFVILKMVASYYFAYQGNLVVREKDMKKLVSFFFLLTFYNTDNKKADELFEKTISLVNIKEFKNIKEAEKKYMEIIESTSKLILEVEKSKKRLEEEVKNKLLQD